MLIPLNKFFLAQTDYNQYVVHPTAVLKIIYFIKFAFSVEMHKWHSDFGP